MKRSIPFRPKVNTFEKRRTRIRKKMAGEFSHFREGEGKREMEKRRLESAELFDESPAGNSSTIGSDLFRDFLQTCHQRNDKWRLPFTRLQLSPSSTLVHSLLFSFILLLSPSRFFRLSSMLLFRGSRMPRLCQRKSITGPQRRAYTGRVY